MIDARVLQMIRADVARTLDRRCTIYREAAGVDGFGYPAHDLVEVAVDVPCRLIRAGVLQREAGDVVGDQEVMVERYRLICPHDTSLGVDMVVDIDGTRFDVTAIWTRQTDATDAQAIIARRAD